MTFADATDAALAAATSLAATWISGSKPPLRSIGPTPEEVVVGRLCDALAHGGTPAGQLRRSDPPVGPAWRGAAAPIDLCRRPEPDTAPVWLADIEVDRPDEAVWAGLRALGAAAQFQPEVAAYVLVGATSYDWLVGEFHAFLAASVGERTIHAPTAELIRGQRVGWSAALAAHPSIRPVTAPRVIATTVLAAVPIWDGHELRLARIEVEDPDPIRFDHGGWPAS